MKRGSAAILLAVVLVAAIGIIVLFSQPSTTGMQFRQETGYEPYSQPTKPQPAPTKPSEPKPQPTRQQDRQPCPENKPSCTKSGEGESSKTVQGYPPDYRWPEGAQTPFGWEIEVKPENYPDIAKDACARAFQAAQKNAVKCLMEELDKLAERGCPFAMKGCNEVGRTPPKCYFSEKSTGYTGPSYAPTYTSIKTVRCTCKVDVNCDP